MDFHGDLEEEAHFGDVVLSLAEYAADAESEILRRERAFSLMDPQDVMRICLDGGSARFIKLRQCARANQEVFDLVVLPYTANIQARAKAVSLASNASVQSTAFVLSPQTKMSKARSTLHQISREWSQEGREERDRCFAPIIRELAKYCKKGGRIAVPGCGLGRLVVEIVAQGYRAEGSEFSYQMLLTGDFIMNRAQTKESFTVFPWIDQASNVRRFDDQVREVRFPDVPCLEILGRVPREYLSVCAGDFEDIYSGANHQAQWDAVVCCFFLDTAANLCDYLRVISKMLKPGGTLMSFGPLLWHFQPEHGGPARHEEDQRFMRSVEFSLEDVKRLIESFGFTIVHDEQIKDCRYAGNQLSMIKTHFDCEFIVAIKA